MISSVKSCTLIYIHMELGEKLVKPVMMILNSLKMKMFYFIYVFAY